MLVYSYTNIIKLTQQNNNTGQDGNQSSGAQPCWQDERFHITGEDGVFAVTAAHTNYKSIGAAHRRYAVVIDLNGKVVHILGHSAEALPDHKDASSAVCGSSRRTLMERLVQLMRRLQDFSKFTTELNYKVFPSLEFRCHENYPQPPVRVNEV